MFKLKHNVFIAKPVFTSKIKYYLSEDYSAKRVFDDTHPVMVQFHRGFFTNDLPDV